MEYAIIFLTLLGIYNLLGYWRLDYKIGNIRPVEKKTSKKAVIHEKKPKKRSRARI